MTQLLFSLGCSLVAMTLVFNILMLVRGKRKPNTQASSQPIQSGDPWQYIGQNVLITTSNWFYGKDGKQYRAVYGKLKGVFQSKQLFGFSPNASHANWIIEVGDMVITGCQVNYLIKTDSPNFDEVEDWGHKAETGGCVRYTRPTTIYRA